jgi:teichoic acid transport system ATP-binding protein
MSSSRKSLTFDRNPLVLTEDPRKPVVIVDDLHVVYRVFPTGKRATRAQARSKLFRFGKNNIREVHAVKGVSFVVYEGETIGLIGSNGSGKSTLMAAIAGMTVAEQGRVFASSRPTLLGVISTILPRISGERNIILGGMALGARKKEMAEAVPAITKFAGLEEFIDLPMRTYSAGMSARLRFAIAAHKDHEILIVDEALSVGDQQFQRRSEARVRELRERAGTVFLVSHIMETILETCNRVIWLEKGVIRMDGDPKKVTKAYTAFMDEISG